MNSSQEQIEHLKEKIETLQDEIRELKAAKTAHKEFAIEANESRAILEAVFESLPFDLFALDLDMNCILQNKASRRWGNTLGKKPEDVASDPSTLEIWLENNRRALSGETVDEEVSLKLGDKVGYYRNIIRPIREGDEILGIVGMNIDMTERRQLEKDLRESEAKYRMLTEESVVGVYIVQEETFVYVNPSLARIVGYTKDEMVGKLGPADIVHEDDFQTAMQRQRDLLSGKKMKDPHTYRAFKKDGTLLHVQVFSTLSTFQGEPSLVGTLIDVTERKQTEDMLHRYSQIVSSSGDMLALLDLNYIYRAANDAYARAFKKRKDEIVGNSARELFGEEFFRTVILPHSKRCLAGEETRFETWVAFANQRRFMEVTYFPYVVESGEIKGFVVNGRDITQQKEMEAKKTELEEQLHRVQRMEAIGTLVGGITHDFNNLLGAILAASSVLMLDLDPESDEFELAEIIENAGQRAAEITRSLLDFSRQKKGKRQLVDIHGVMEEVIKLVEHTSDRRITISDFPIAAPSTVMGDSGQLQQVLLNIAVNARDAMSNGGELKFETGLLEAGKGHAERDPSAPPGTYLFVKISDTGIGMSEEVALKAFDPFFTTKEVRKGTGLGLSSSYGIVKNHGGWITIESKVGKGTAVTVYLPLTEEGPPEGPTSASTKTAGPLARILLVEDEESLLTLGRKMLARMGHQVSCAENGQKALSIYKEERNEIDLVILDMTMPVMNGMDCFRELRAMDPTIKVLIATGHRLEESTDLLKAEGVYGLLHKPYVFGELADAVNRVLAIGDDL